MEEVNIQLTKQDIDRIYDYLKKLKDIERELFLNNDILLSAKPDWIDKESFEYLDRLEANKQRCCKIALEKIESLKDNILTFSKYNIISKDWIQFLEIEFDIIKKYLEYFREIIKLQKEQNKIK